MVNFFFFFSFFYSFGLSWNRSTLGVHGMFTHWDSRGPPAEWCVALMSAAESPQILVVLLSTSFPPFVAARHVFGIANLVHLSARNVCSSEGVR